MVFDQLNSFPLIRDPSPGDLSVIFLGFLVGLVIDVGFGSPVWDGPGLHIGYFIIIIHTAKMFNVYP